jgi:hypothetical protein
MTLSALQSHARALAVAFDVQLVEDPRLKPDEACALTSGRVVFAAPVIEETTYAVVLHEIGHLASPTGIVRHAVAPGGNPASVLLIEEEAAWAWAQHYALEWTPVMESVKTWALGTYQENLRRQPVTPAPVARPRVPIDWSRYDS